MMKRALLCCVLLLAVTLLCGFVSVRSVRAHNYDDIISRIVVELSSGTEYRIEADRSGTSFRIIFPNSGLDTFRPEFTAHHRTINRIETYQSLNDAVVHVLTNDPCSHLSMVLSSPYRIVVDIFCKNISSKTERMALADFHGTTGRLQRADEAYEKLARDYPSDAEILFKWGELLLKRDKKTKAMEALDRVPTNSSYYPRAQKLFGKTAAVSKPLPKDSGMPEDSPSDYAPSAQDTIPDSYSDVTPAPAKSPLMDQLIGFSDFSYVLVIAILVVSLLVLLFRSTAVFNAFLNIILFPFGASRKAKQVQKQDVEPDSNQLLEDTTLARMIDRLANDGWTVKEIAIELKINRNEVQRIMQKSRRNSD